MTQETESPTSEPEFTIKIVNSIADVARETWDGLANPAGVPFDPFLSWDFLQALEESGCATSFTGWGGRHLLCLDGAQNVVGLVPLWLKSHSQGEYIFDHNFADAWQRAGGRWYPKLTSAVPFTPVPGRRLLVKPDEDSGLIRVALISALEQIGAQSGLATVQVNFAKDEDLAALDSCKWLLREDRQFHFFNPGYQRFEDFLAELSSDKRKNLRKERAKAKEGIEIVRLTGSEILEEHWDHFFECYQDTGARYERRPSLDVEPLGDWGKGNVRLVEIPSDLEANDNIVAYWVPETPAKAGDEREFAYRLHWGDLPHDPAEALAYVFETRSGHGGFAGVEAEQGTRKFVVDFKGGLIGPLDPDTAIEPVVSVSNGEVTSTVLEKIAETDIWRLVIDISAAPDAVVELSAHLAGFDRRLTETWLYQWINAS